MSENLRLHWPKQWIEAAWQKAVGFKELIHRTARAVPLLGISGQLAGRIPVKAACDEETAFLMLDIRSLTRRIASGSVDSEPKRRLLLLPERGVCDTSGAGIHVSG